MLSIPNVLFSYLRLYFEDKIIDKWLKSDRLNYITILNGKTCINVCGVVITFSCENGHGCITKVIETSCYNKMIEKT